MPNYEYRCTHCGERATFRRRLEEIDDAIESLCCGALMEREFSRTSNIFIPIHCQAVRQGGVANNLSWSDFHDVSERELAHLKDEDGRPIEVVPAAEAMSRAGTQDRSRRRKENANA